MPFSESFLDDCFQYAQKYKLFCCDAILVAVSGGIDSMCLMHVLSCLKKCKENTFPVIYAIHLNHGIRGQDATEDLKLIESYAKELGIDVFSKFCDVKNVARQKKIGIEEAGRKERYKYFAEVKHQLENRHKKIFVATAHHMDDQAESMLMHLFRGAGIDGLAGMRAKADELIRPFLFLEKKRIFIYAQEARIPFHEDKTNSENLYMRNRWRNKILPVIEEQVGDPAPVLSRLSELIQMDQDYFEKKIKKIVDPVLIRRSKSARGIPCNTFLLQSPAIQNRMIRYLYQTVFGNLCDLEKNHVDSILDLLKTCKNGTRKSLPNQRIVYIYNQILYMGLLSDYTYENAIFYHDECRKVPLFPKGSENYTIPLESFAAGKYTKIIDSHFFLGIFCIENREKVVYNNMTWCCRLELIGKAEIRTQRSGDSFLRAGSSGKKSLRRCFTDWKVPEIVRDRVMLIASGNEVLWIPGLGHAQGSVDEISEKRFRETTGMIHFSDEDICRIEIDTKMED